MNPAVRELLHSRRAELGLAPVADTIDPLDRVLIASDLAFDVLRRQPELLAWLRRPGDWPVEDLPAVGDDGFAEALRRYRRRHSVRLIARDLFGLDSVPETLGGATQLAESCIEQALAQAATEL